MMPAKQTLTDHAEITAWLITFCAMDINGAYRISADGVVDITGSITISHDTITELPISFNTVSGRLVLNTPALTTLKGCPVECFSFTCDNTKIVNLQHAPARVEYFNCAGCRDLTSLEGSPRECISFNVDNCEKLCGLQGAVSKVSHFMIQHTPLNSLAGCPQDVHSIMLNDIPITSLHGIPATVPVMALYCCAQLTSFADAPKYIGSLDVKYTALETLDGGTSITKSLALEGSARLRAWGDVDLLKLKRLKCDSIGSNLPLPPHLPALTELHAHRVDLNAERAREFIQNRCSITVEESSAVSDLLTAWHKNQDLLQTMSDFKELYGEPLLQDEPGAPIGGVEL